MPRRAGQLPDPEPATSARSAARSRALTVPAVSDLPPAEAALLWAAAGFPVFPCIATNHDKGRDKWAKRPHPMLSEMGASRGEGGWKLATTAVTQIAEWWRTDPSAMIGIPPGLVGAVVLDCDGEPGVDAVTRIAGVEGYDLEQTFLVATPGHGLHVWFDRRSGGVEHRISNGHLLDIPGEARGDRGYVIVPPSHLPDGKQYTITGPSMSLDELPQWAAFLLPWEPRNAPDRAIGEITTAEEQAWLRKYSKEPNREGRDELARSLTAIQVATSGDAHLGRHPTATREVARLLSLTRRGSIKLDLIDAIEELRSALVGVKPKGGPDFDRFVADAIALRVKEDSALTIDLSLVPEIDQAEWDRREAERVTRITETTTAGAPGPDDGAFVSWNRIPLDGDLPALERPTMLYRDDGEALIYANKVNVIFGEPETGKTWIAIAAVIEVVNRGLTAVVLDFEDNETIWRDRLLDAGLAHGLLPKISYIRPDEPFDPRRLPVGTIREFDKAEIVVIDSWNEAMAVQGGLNPIDNMDVLKWRNLVLRQLSRLTQAAITTIDHTAMGDTPNRLDALGARAKRGGIQGIQIKVKVVQAPMPGSEGVMDLYVAKDRSGYVRAVSQVPEGDNLPFTGRFVMRPQPGRGRRATSLHLYAPRSLSNKPDQTMIDRVMATMRQNPVPLSITQIKDMTTGRAIQIGETVKWLQDEGRIVATRAGRGVAYGLADIGDYLSSGDADDDTGTDTGTTEDDGLSDE